MQEKYAQTNIFAKNVSRPGVLTIAGSDSSGMSGIQMDNQVQRALGVHSNNIITATTAQNNTHYINTHAVAGEILFDQASALEQQSLGAIKSGLIHQGQIQDIAKIIKIFNLPYICDPVLSTSSGHSFIDNNSLQLWKDNILPLCTLITPNIPEAEQLTGINIHSADDIEQASLQLIEMGAQSVVIKGGHFNYSEQYSQDFFRCKHLRFWMTSPTIETHNTRGTGCAFASAVAASIALGYPVEDAVVIAKMTVNQGLRQGYSVVNKNTVNTNNLDSTTNNSNKTLSKGPIFVTQFPNKQEDLPIISAKIEGDLDNRQAFPQCTYPKLGIYPVVDSAEWLAKLLPLGIKTAQVRIKGLTGKALENEIIQAIHIGKEHNCQLFINDYWELAIQHNAYGVHLGQEDLDTADTQAIHNAGLRLGISTHCHYEVARAHRYQPSYIACGPVYETNTKIMPWTPQGLKNLNYWQSLLNYPLVAIGGINIERTPTIAKTGVSGIAMITAITLADNPEATTKELMHLAKI